jgi:TolB protein
MARSLTAVLSFSFLLAAAAARAADPPPIVITDPSQKTYRAAIQEFLSISQPGMDGLAGEIYERIRAGLEFSGLFDVIEPKAFLGPVRSVPLDSDTPVVCTNWRQIGADALVEGEVQATREEARIEFRVRDVSRGCLRMVRKRYTSDRREAARIGSAIADDIVGLFTGQPGVADTEIAFISNRSGSKEVHVMNADGTRVRSATHNGSINSFPNWSPSGREIVYTSYRYRNRPHLFMLTRGRRSPGRILRNLNAGEALYRGVFSPDGDRLALVMSIDGTTEILTVKPNGRSLERLTRNRVIDISPTWSPDGERIAFVSDRAGTPQIYVMDRDGSDVRRLTFSGSYNTSPAWSPEGGWIAYESRVGSQFDIWLIDPDGRENFPLVTHPRSDEHPTWSPDGRKIAFSSTRRGHADVYTVDLNGENLRRITQAGGDNTNPHWGPYRRTRH